MNRKGYLQASALTLGLGALSNINTSKAYADSAKVELKTNDVILFQGDSITDARRDKKSQNANHVKALGGGYPLLIGSQLLEANPTKNLRVYNRGISGNKVPDLKKRWQKDCLDLKPAVLSILVGVNDIWHKMNGRYDGTVETYKTGFMKLIEETKQALPQTKIVICEPFALRCGAVKDSWYPEFDQRRAKAKEVAQETNSIWVPFQTMFDEAVAAGTKPQYWAGDGVHPSLAGHALMAKTWREVVGI